ncbi:MAG: type I-E CRISPR-associated protein Cas7/Cse4/CasC [Gammaproteobacteria bacterium SHHR-1]
MFIELHMLQNFAPSNLNRSDTGAPKDCTFGGSRRARISSQCIKRAIRKHPVFEQRVVESGGNVGTRTKRVLKRLAELLEDTGHDTADIERVCEVMLGGVKLEFKLDEKKGMDNETTAIKKSQYLLYLSETEIQALADIAREHWVELKAIQIAEAEEANKKQKKTASKEAVPKEIQKKIAAALRDHPALAADIALFGRMLADAKEMNVDAACQVAHALSTHRVASMEMDFYTAVDDLLPSEDSGSDMMGIVEFNSACYYRYAQINLEILKRNLKDDREAAIGAVLGFLEAAALAVPTGMQNSMAAQNPPSYIRVMFRSSGAPWSLANAFVMPVRGDDEQDLIRRSVSNLETYLGKLQNAYGADGFELDRKMDVEGLEGSVPLPQLLADARAALEARWDEVR